MVGSMLFGFIPTRAADQPAGTVRLTGKSLAAGIGFS